MQGLSLFSGCGGLDLAAEMAGITVVGQCEIDKACQAVLRRRWPDAELWGDIRYVTADSIRSRCGEIDLVFGGPPCQPISVAGRRKAAGDSRNLWPEFLRVIRDVRPRWVVAENPTGIISAQKIKGDARQWPKGEFFGEIVRDIAALGYRVGWGVWGACDVGAPHKRERVFIVARLADTESERREWTKAADTERHEDWRLFGGVERSGDVGNASGARRQECNSTCVADRKRYLAGQHSGRTLGDAEHDGSPAAALARSYGEIAGDSTEGTILPIELAGAGRPGYDANVAVAEGERRGETREHCARSTERVTGCSEDCERHGLEPGLGGDTDGSTCGLDVPNWPAGRGAAQLAWEPPRVVPRGEPGRAARLRMLGNSVVPAQALPLFQAVVEIERSVE